MAWSGDEYNGVASHPSSVVETAMHAAEAYSYLDSVGYCRVLVEKVWRLYPEAGRLKTVDFWPLFSDALSPRARAYFELNFDVNERAALKEMTKTPRSELVARGILAE